MRKGFTLIELIFVIIIIGILAGVALPKYKGMKENAEVTNVFKVVQDAISSVPPAYLNLQDLNGTKAEIGEIFVIKGSPFWSLSIGTPQTWQYTGPNGDLNASIQIDNSANPAVLQTKITVVNDANNLKFQKLKRLVGGASSFNGVYDVNITLE
jgi:prepilin-type N-terminal cleavage/methylation domain-containing protein